MYEFTYVSHATLYSLGPRGSFFKSSASGVLKVTYSVKCWI